MTQEARRKAPADFTAICRHHVAPTEETDIIAHRDARGRRVPQTKAGREEEK
jgi:hypothetical protein